MKTGTVDLKNLPAQLNIALHRVRKYIGFIFVISLIGIYAFLGWHISVLANAAPSADATAQVVNSHVVKVDPAVLSKIQQLQDNSVNVQALFSNARSNPFQ